MQDNSGDYFTDNPERAKLMIENCIRAMPEAKSITIRIVDVIEPGDFDSLVPLTNILPDWLEALAHLQMFMCQKVGISPPTTMNGIEWQIFNRATVKRFPTLRDAWNEWRQHLCELVMKGGTERDSGLDKISTLKAGSIKDVQAAVSAVSTTLRDAGMELDELSMSKVLNAALGKMIMEDPTWIGSGDIGLIEIFCGFTVSIGDHLPNNMIAFCVGGKPVATAIVKSKE